MENLEHVVETETRDLFLADDSQDHSDDDDLKMEYIEALESNDDSITADEAQLPHEEDSLLEARIEEIIRIPNSRPQIRKQTGENKNRGRDIYQKLLQECELCSKMIEKNRMEGHMNKHNNIRPFHCEEDGCDKTFYCKLLLRLHRTSIHTGLQIACSICNKTFPSDRSLYAHKLRHRNEDRYNCTHCERKFNNSNSLKRHLAIHSGIREYSCSYCASSFYRKFNLGESTRCA